MRRKLRRVLFLIMTATIVFVGCGESNATKTVDKKASIATEEKKSDDLINNQKKEETVEMEQESFEKETIRKRMLRRKTLRRMMQRKILLSRKIQSKMIPRRMTQKLTRRRKRHQIKRIHLLLIKSRKQQSLPHQRLLLQNLQQTVEVIKRILIRQNQCISIIM